ANAAPAEAEADSAKIEQRRSRSLSKQPLLASRSAFGTVSDRNDATATAAAPTPASASAPASATGSASAAAAPAAPPVYQASADSWLREINRLRASGKTAEADRELIAFRQAYPSHPGYSLARPPTR
ncbi:MAG TPA: hypothetical protein VGO53_16860, partial [Steroidobacteraceae bacterium]|nr:hypothetical protein [Steroidobacteraceae bacterium]